MSRRLKTESLISTRKAPFAKIEVDHIQQNYLEIPAAIIQGFLGAYTANELVVLYGCAVSISGGNASVTKGAMYYNGEVFQVAAASGIAGASGGTEWVWNISDVSVQSKFSDGNLYDWMETRTIVLNGALYGSGIADYTNVTPFKPTTTDRQTDHNEGLAASVPTGGGPTQIGATLTTAGGLNKNYKLEFTWVYNKISTDPEMYMKFYKNGSVLATYHHVANSVAGASQVNTIHYMDLDVAPGTTYDVRLTSPSGNQYLLQAYHFSIDGVA